MNLVATGIRSTVLLDSRRAPRGSPPLANVLRALQDSRKCKTTASSSSDNCCTDDIASLGLLMLDGSSFLVNRRVLRSRLAEILTPCTATTHAISWATTHPHGANIANVVDNCENLAGRGRRKTLPTAGKLPSPANYSRGGCTVPAERDFVLVDVRRSIRMPRLCTELLAPQLVAVLRSMFGDVNAADTSTWANDNPSDAQRKTDIATSTFPTNSSSQETSEGRPSREPGHRWLQDWGRTALTYEVGDDLRTTLGDVGMPGLAGWLLEYPVIYCCRPMFRRNDDQVEGSTQAFSGGDPGNCLAMAHLTVYSVGVEFGEKLAPTSPPSSSDSKVFEAFSFSIPETVHAETESDGGVTDAVPGYLSGLVDKFAARVEGRITRCGSNSCQCRSSLSTRIVVRRRTEVLDRVAL